MRGGNRAGQMRTLIACFLIAAGACPTSASAQKASEACKPVYLTFDTGHMGVAPLVADVLKQRGVRATFFAAQEATKEGDGTLGKHWAPWWLGLKRLVGADRPRRAVL